MTTPKMRPGDTVLIRAKVVDARDGFVRDMKPMIEYSTGFAPAYPDFFEIVEVEHAFRVGDRVYLGQIDENVQIVALSPKDVDPPQAWVKLDDGSLRTVITKNIRRVES